ncbi:hypothetical protein ACOSQ2_018985 [Xanthoceras sorbifolium]
MDAAPRFFSMSSLSDLEYYKVDVGGILSPEECHSRPSDEVVIKYERFMSMQQTDEVDDSSQVTLGRSQMQVENFISLPSIITNEDLVGYASTFHLPMGHKVLIAKVIDRPAHPPPGYVAISLHHLHAGLRFPFSKFLICVLNLLRLAPMQLTPNAYTQLIFFYLTFRRRGVGSPSDNIIRYCYLLKKCPLFLEVLWYCLA